MERFIESNNDCSNYHFKKPFLDVVRGRFCIHNIGIIMTLIFILGLHASTAQSTHMKVSQGPEGMRLDKHKTVSWWQHCDNQWVGRGQHGRECTSSQARQTVTEPRASQGEKDIDPKSILTISLLRGDQEPVQSGEQRWVRVGAQRNGSST